MSAIRVAAASILLCILAIPTARRASAQDLKQGFTAEDVAEFNAYRASVPTLKKVTAVTRAATAIPKTHPEFEAMRNVLVTIQDSLGMMSDRHGSLSFIEREVSRIPALTAALAAQRVTAREYVKFYAIVVQAYMVHVVSSAVPGAGDIASDSFGSRPSPANLAFVSANKHAVESLFERITAFASK